MLNKGMIKVAFISVSHKSISLVSTGGLETFAIYYLNQLKRSNYKITLFAAKETDLSLFPGIDFVDLFSLADIQEVKDEDLESKAFTLNYSMFQYASLAKVLKRKDEFDIVHFSCAQWYAASILSQNTDKLIISTIHVNNLKENPLNYVLNNFKKTYLVNISNFSSIPFSNYENRETVYNGIDLNLFPFQVSSDSYFGWLGRIAPAKGLKEALLAAKKADIEFTASGPRDFAEYYQKEIVPLLDNKRKLIYPLDLKTKGKFLSSAKAILLPIQWEEPFGLVMIEAMACGTPVIAYNRGSVPEILRDGLTGFIIDPDDEDRPGKGGWIIKKQGIEGLVEAIKRIGEIDRRACREHVEVNFSVEKMVNGYEKVYETVIGKNKL